MDNVLQDMVQRLRAIELLLRTQNELLTRVQPSWNRQGDARRRARSVECVNLPDTQWMAGDDCREVKQQSGPSAKLMGRWRSGAPLVLAPDKADPDAGAGPLRGRMSLASHRVRSNHPAPGLVRPGAGTRNTPPTLGRSLV